MIPEGRNTPIGDPPDQIPFLHVSTQSPTARKTILPDAQSGSSSVFSKSYSMTPPRPSTAPPHPSTDTTKGKEAETDLQTRTTLVSNLRARNLLFQKAISHIDDAVLHLMAARSGIPNSKIQQVRSEARNRRDLLDKVDRAIKMAQNGELHEERQGGDMSGGTRSGKGGERYASITSLGERKPAGLFSGITSSDPRNIVHPLPSNASLDAPQLRRSSSQPQLGPSMGQPQTPTKIYTLPELVERRKVLQESIESWKSFAGELRAAQPCLEGQAQSAPIPPDVASTQAFTEANTPSNQAQEPSLTVKYQRAQFEIKRREDLLLRLNQAIVQVSQPTPEQAQIAALASYIPPALDRPHFDAAYAHFCQGKSIQMNTTIIMPDASRPVIDVYLLHVAVMQEGSFPRVSTRKSWDVVAARLGFIETPATATEPARSSPEVATHLEKAYMDRLHQFDHLYVSSVMETVRKRIAEQLKKA